MVAGAPTARSGTRTVSTLRDTLMVPPGPSSGNRCASSEQRRASMSGPGCEGCRRSRPEAKQGLLGEGGDEGAVDGEDLAVAEAASVGEYRAVVAHQQPVVRPEGVVEPDGVRGGGGSEGGSIPALAAVLGE